MPNINARHWQIKMLEAVKKTLKENYGIDISLADVLTIYLTDSNKNVERKKFIEKVVTQIRNNQILKGNSGGGLQ